LNAQIHRKKYHFKLFIKYPKVARLLTSMFVNTGYILIYFNFMLVAGLATTTSFNVNSYRRSCLYRMCL